MKLEERFVIDGNAVNYITAFGDISVYEQENPNSTDDDDKVFFFVKKGTVLQALHISAGMSQGQGYISQCDFVKP